MKSECFSWRGFDSEVLPKVWWLTPLQRASNRSSANYWVPHYIISGSPDSTWVLKGNSTILSKFQYKLLIINMSTLLNAFLFTFLFWRLSTSSDIWYYGIVQKTFLSGGELHICEGTGCDYFLITITAYFTPRTAEPVVSYPHLFQNKLDLNKNKLTNNLVCDMVNRLAEKKAKLLDAALSRVQKSKRNAKYKM